jgi:hypothetical protein
MHIDNARNFYPSDTEPDMDDDTAVSDALHQHSLVGFVVFLYPLFRFFPLPKA